MLTKNTDFKLCVVAYHSYFVIILRIHKYFGIRAQESAGKVNIYLDVSLL